jgi:predicted extracellular nuclease
MTRFLIFLSLFLSSSVIAQKGYNSLVMFYNVENLFDTLDTQGKNDSEFLPNGEKEWTGERYMHKIDRINEVINNLDNPVIIGLCEVENKTVVSDIVKYGDLSLTHAIVHHESMDNRGIDNALIYDSTRLKLIEDGIIRFDMPEGNSPSRDIVWAKFNRGGETLFVLVNHWPSRRGGQLISEPKRLIAANAAAAFIDSLQSENKNAQIVFMGDLNDTPEDRAPQLIQERLQPQISLNSGDFGGTHNYRGEWSVLDHIMVSKATLKNKGAIRIKKKTGQIQSPDYLLTTYKENIVPFRTYGGRKYLDGYSDHLPVTVEIELK